MSVVIGSVDISGQVQEKSYKVDRENVYTSVKDADGIEYRNVYRTKVTGSFDVWFVTNYGVSYSDFLTALATATANNVTLITLDIQNTGTSESINCYYKIKTKSERKVNSTTTLKIVTVSVEEQ